MIRVAVFGGDGRGYLVERYDPGVIVVTAYEGDAANARRVAAAVHEGSFTHVVALTRWMNHPQYKILKDACGATGVKLVTWTRGIGSLKKEIASWVPETPRAPEKKPIEWIPRIFEMKETEMQTAAQDNHKPSTQKWRGATESIKSALAIDSSRKWTVKELAEFIYSRTDREALAAIGAVLNRLEKQEEILCVGGVAKSNKNPKQYVVRFHDRPREEHPVQPSSTPPPSPTPEPPKQKSDEARGFLCLRVDPDGPKFRTHATKEEALEDVRKYPGTRIFREVKLRVTVEIDE